MMNLKVQYYGMLAEIAGVTSENWEVETPTTIGDLKTKIQAKYLEMKISQIKVAVDLQISADHVFISPNSTIALLPPFAGG